MPVADNLSLLRQISFDHFILRLKSTASSAVATGKVKRRHLHIQKKDRIHYIGKEADQIEQVEILGMDDESYMEYRKARM
jgi:hypothetical protein